MSTTMTPAIPTEHLSISQAEVIDMILRAAHRANTNTNRIVVAEAHEQNAYWTLVLVEILRQVCGRPSATHADAMFLVRNAAALAARSNVSEA